MAGTSIGIVLQDIMGKDRHRLSNDLKGRRSIEFLDVLLFMIISHRSNISRASSMVHSRAEHVLSHGALCRSARVDGKRSILVLHANETTNRSSPRFYATDHLCTEYLFDATESYEDQLVGPRMKRHLQILQQNIFCRKSHQSQPECEMSARIAC